MTRIGAMIRRDVPPGAVAAHAQIIEQGFDELWVVEDLRWAGGISQMGAVLEATDHVIVGHGIAPAPFRNAAALAMEWATLAELYPGRIAAGVGHGLQHWMAEIGERVDSPLTLLSETIGAIRQLLAGATVTVHGDYVALDKVALHWPPLQIPPVSAGVAGPKSLRLSGAVADGTILPEGRGPDDIRAALGFINDGRSDAGRTDHHRLTVFAGFYCGDLDELGPPPADVDSDGWGAVDPDPAVVADGLQQLIDAGADSVILVPYGDDAAQQLKFAASEIVPRLEKK